MAFENKYNAKDVEPKILKFWEENNIFKFDENSQKVVFSIDTPPPTISGKMHIGHAFSFTQTDFMARFKRMKGFEVFYPFGTDDNGLATEKLVQKVKKVNLRKVPREEAIKICLDYLEEERPNFIQDFKNVGLSCDWNVRYSTIDDKSRKLSQTTFLTLYNKGLIYRKEGPVMWDRVFQTPIAQAELEDEEKKSFMNYVRAKIVNSENTFVIFATTRPELLFACAGMSVEDTGDYVKLKVNLVDEESKKEVEEFWIISAKTYEENMKKFGIDESNFEVVEELKGQNIIGESAIIPVTEKEIEITHDEAVLADFGTGIAYFCSYGGIEDIEYFARHNLEPISVLNPDGKLNEKTGEFEGIIATEARPKVIAKLKDIGSLIFSEPITHIVNVGERSGTEVEFIVTKQWYVKYLDRREEFFEKAQEFIWHPNFMKHRLENWIKGLNWDYGFSRQRHYGIPVPIWYCKECGKIKLADESQLPVDPTNAKPIGSCECGCKEFVGETDVMDTWFTSASSPFLAIDRVENEEMKKKLFPMDLRPQAHDIINFWLFYTMAKTNLLYGENPFKNVAISGWVLDPQGKKMSKSKGNTIVPQEVVAKFSNDALRYAASSTKLGNDIPYQEKEVQSGVKLINKLYNANKFAAMLLEDFDYNEGKINLEELYSIDKWILARCQEVAVLADEAFENYDYQKAKQLWYDFFMGDIADNYIEIVKERLWKKKEGYKSAQSVLYNVLFNSLKGLAPFVPFISEEIYMQFYKDFEGVESIHRCSYPEKNEDFVDEKLVEFGTKYLEVVGSVRRFKAEQQISMKEQLEIIRITCSDELKKFILNSIVDLKAVTGAKTVSFKEGDFEINIEK